MRHPEKTKVSQQGSRNSDKERLIYSTKKECKLKKLITIEEKGLTIEENIHDSPSLEKRGEKKEGKGRIGEFER